MSTFGQYLRVTTFGESHGKYVGVVVDGFPSQIRFPHKEIQGQLERRRPGQSRLTSARCEWDTIEVVSGVDEQSGLTLGSPITLLVANRDMRPQDYKAETGEGRETPSPWIPRPGHADLSYSYKYGLLATSGGGRASARETVGRVAAGALAEYYLSVHYGIECVAYVDSVGPYGMTTTGRREGEKRWRRACVDATAVRCPEPELAAQMEAYIVKLQEMGDSTGGSIACVVRNVPAGLGEPVFDKLSARLAYAMMSIPSARGFAFGRGFEACAMRGSEHNDPIQLSDEASCIEMGKNDAGGLYGGISTGGEIVFRVAFKPPSTIALPQASVKLGPAGRQREPTTLRSRGRHDPCVVPRAVPIVEAMAALTLLDLLLAQKAKHLANTHLHYADRY